MRIETGYKRATLYPDRRTVGLTEEIGRAVDQAEAEKQGVSAADIMRQCVSYALPKIGELRRKKARRDKRKRGN